jgi:hypothetical protein
MAETHLKRLRMSAFCRVRLPEAFSVLSRLVNGLRRGAMAPGYGGPPPRQTTFLATGDAMNVVSQRRGDLPRRYRIVGWASAIITAIVVVAGTLFLDPLRGNAGAAITMALFWSFRAALTVWVVVGVWHSWTRDQIGGD